MGQIKQKTQVKIRAAGYTPTHSRTDITIRDTGFTIDEPEERGGTNEGPSPTETSLAALIGCTNTIGNKCAKKLDVDIGHMQIDLVCELDRRGVMLMEELDNPFVAIELTVTADGPASDADLQRVAAEVEKYCAVSKLFKAAGTKVTATWRKA